MKNLSYHLLYALAYVLSLLPFAVLYVLADGCFLFLYYIIRYRRAIVRRNLSSSFPDKSEAELRQTERRFYRWLCDYGVETLKLLTISDEALLRRFEFHGAEQVERVFDEGRDCAAILGHYCNWEWLSATSLAFKGTRHTSGQSPEQPAPVMGLIYHPLYNEAFDRLFIDIRSAHHGTCIPKKDILRHLVTLKHEGRRSFFGYISDQVPKWENMHLWLPFLNHDTPVFTGGERIMRKMDNAVFYIGLKRPRRGYYTCTFELISEHAAQEPENVITTRFFQRLEESIRQEPSYYLWTHNRWKRGREEFERKYDVIDGKIIRKEAYK